MKLIVTAILPILLSGCGLIMVAQNRDRLNDLKVGMTKDQVVKLMGRPYQTEAIAETEWLFYKIDLMYDPGLIPLAFENGILVGWGRNFYTKEAEKYDITIRER
jgi:hypothetical protein